MITSHRSISLTFLADLKPQLTSVHSSFTTATYLGADDVNDLAVVRLFGRRHDEERASFCDLPARRPPTPEGSLIRWTGLAPWELISLFQIALYLPPQYGSLTNPVSFYKQLCSFLEHALLAKDESPGNLPERRPHLDTRVTNHSKHQGEPS